MTHQSNPLFLPSPTPAPFRPADTHSEVRFDRFGDGIGRYNIFTYLRAGGGRYRYQ